MALTGSDLAILTARFGDARFGASRFGFIPCPEDVMGAGTAEPGEYIWKETHPPVTDWTLVNEDCACRDLCTLALSAISINFQPTVRDEDIIASFDLTGVLGLVDGIVRINWGDGRHDESAETPLVNGAFLFVGHYHEVGDYTMTITVTDERGCEVSATRPVSVVSFIDASFTFGEDDGVVTFDSTVTGGSGDYSYAWSMWSEHGGSEGSPAYTSTDADPTIVVLIPTTTGLAKLVVTDNVTMNVFTVGPQAWTYGV